LRDGGSFPDFVPATRKSALPLNPRYVYVVFTVPVEKVGELHAVMTMVGARPFAVKARLPAWSLDAVVSAAIPC
jgi:hypothetical protein